MTFFPRQNGQNPGIRLRGHPRSHQWSRQRGNEQECPRKCNQRRTRQGPSLPPPIFLELSSRQALRPATSRATSLSMVSYQRPKGELRLNSSTPPLVKFREMSPLATSSPLPLGQQEYVIAASSSDLGRSSPQSLVRFAEEGPLPEGLIKRDCAGILDALYLKSSISVKIGEQPKNGNVACLIGGIAVGCRCNLSGLIDRAANLPRVRRR